MDGNYHQQTPPSLTFASLLAKLNLVKRIRNYVDAFTPQKVHMRSIKNSPLD